MDKVKFNKIVLKLRELHKADMGRDEIVKVINDLELPLNAHLAIMGDYRRLVEGKL